MAAYLLSDNARAMVEFLQDNRDGQFDAMELSEMLNLAPKTVNGVATGLARRGLVERVEVEGRDRKVIQLTDNGHLFDVNTLKDAPQE